MSRRRLGALAAVGGLCVLALGCATERAAAPVAESAPRAAAPPLLWKVSKGGQSAWLYGTIHTGGEALVPASAWTALATAKVFVMETDAERIDLVALTKRAILPEGESLETLLSPASWARCQEALRGRIPTAQLRRYKPWFVAVLILQSLLPPGEATDLALKRRAVEAGARVEFLESAAEQLDAIEGGVDAASLEEMLADPEKARRMLDELLAAYRAGDLTRIEYFSTSPEAISDEGREVLLYARNRRWVPKIAALVAGGQAFVAVGAGHLPGKNGLLELLGGEGFVIERMP